MRLPLIEYEPNGIKRVLWLLLGLTFVGVGMIGIVIPGLPTTIFMILSVGCFYRSSQRLYDWVINHKYFGEHVKNYIEGKGMPRKAKLNSFIFIWVFVIFAVLFGIPDNMVIFKIITIIAALTGTGFIISLRTI